MIADGASIRAANNTPAVCTARSTAPVSILYSLGFVVIIAPKVQEDKVNILWQPRQCTPERGGCPTPGGAERGRSSRAWKLMFNHYACRCFQYCNARGPHPLAPYQDCLCITPPMPLSITQTNKTLPLYEDSNPPLCVARPCCWHGQVEQLDVAAPTHMV